jgi:hypothetical protein
MESVGEENRIRTLFSELRLADEQSAPSFAATWNRARIQSVKQRGFNLAFVAATVLLICAVLSLAWWSTHSQPGPSSNSVAVINSTPNTPPVAAQSTPAPDLIKPTLANQPANSNSKPRALHLATRPHPTMLAADKKILRDAKAISNWQSPTATLLPSSENDLLKSLPELDENSKGMKSFLPNK